MRVVLISEGNTDVTLEVGQASEGAVRVLLRRLIEPLLRREPSPGEITGARLPRRHHAAGYADKVVFACDLHGNDFEAMAVVVDRDRDSTRRAHLESGRARAQERGTSIAFRLAIGVAKESQEAWLLADAGALSQVLNAPGAQPDPETLNDPKSILSSLIANSTLRIAEAYDRLAEHADLDQIRNRSRSFRQFSDEVRLYVVGDSLR